MSYDFVPRFEFENGLLHFHTGGYRARIRWHPGPLAEEQDQHGRWRKCWPSVRLIVPAGEGPIEGVAGGMATCPHETGFDRRGTLRGPDAVAAFRESVPEALANFVEPFRSHQWSLLCLLHEVGEVMDWAVENPVLAYCVANNAEFRAIDDEVGAQEALHHCMQKQADIMHWLKFPRSPAIAKLLKKILPAAAEPSKLRMLRAAIRVDTRVLETLSHQRQIGVGLIALLVHREIRRFVTPGLLAEVAAKSDERLAAPTADMVIRVLHMVSQCPGRALPKPFCSVRAVRNCHEEVAAELRNRENTVRVAAQPMVRIMPAGRVDNPATGRKTRTVRARVPQPGPPIPGTDQIVPILTRKELVEEGREMRNCIASYGQYIRKGSKYAYRVLFPERATLLIVRSSNGRWIRQDLRLKANQLPSLEGVRFVEAWLCTQCHRSPL